jgi:hypothetical protein
MKGYRAILSLDVFKFRLSLGELGAMKQTSTNIKKK